MENLVYKIPFFGLLFFLLLSNLNEEFSQADSSDIKYLISFLAFDFTKYMKNYILSKIKKLSFCMLVLKGGSNNTQFSSYEIMHGPC